MPYDLDMRETGDRTYFGLSAGLAAALISALLFGATIPNAKQLLNGASPLLVAGLLYLGSGMALNRIPTSISTNRYATATITSRTFITGAVTANTRGSRGFRIDQSGVWARVIVVHGFARRASPDFPGLPPFCLTPS